MLGCILHGRVVHRRLAALLGRIERHVQCLDARFVHTEEPEQVLGDERGKSSKEGRTDQITSVRTLERAARRRDTALLR